MAWQSLGRIVEASRKSLQLTKTLPFDLRMLANRWSLQISFKNLEAGVNNYVAFGRTAKTEVDNAAFDGIWNEVCMARIGNLLIC